MGLSPSTGSPARDRATPWLTLLENESPEICPPAALLRMTRDLSASSRCPAGTGSAVALSASRR